MSKHTYQDVPIDSIVPSKDNARHIDQKSESFQELVNSIRASGVQVPIHVWPHPKREGKFEIRAGERRWRACKSLGHKTIPAIVHKGISYDVAMTLTYTENKFREDLAPLEEVAEIARCMDRLNDDAKLIAELLGQTEQWVRLRVNIHKNLIPGWRQAFCDMAKFTGGYGSYSTDWSIGHLIMIARLPTSSQKELLQELKRYPWQWGNLSVRDLDGRISRTLMLLSKAKWNLDDEMLLPQAGSCISCPKRSGAEPVLWFGSADDQIKSKDRCLDHQCWKSKLQIYLQQRAKKLAEKHSNIAYVSSEYMNGNVKEDLSKKFGRVLDPSDIQKSTKGSKGAVPALIVHGNGAGKLTYIKEKKFARPSGTKRTGSVTPLRQRREMLNSKRWAQVLLELKEKVEAAGVDQVVYKEKITGIMALAAILGNDTTWWFMSDSAQQRKLPSSPKAKHEEIEKLVKKKDSETALAYLWESVKPTLTMMLTYTGPVTQMDKGHIEECKWIAKLIQVDIDKMFEEVSQRKGFTEPKSWKNLNADGTPKAVKKTKKKKSA